MVAPILFIVHFVFTTLFSEVNITRYGKGTGHLIASAQDHLFTFVQAFKPSSYINLFVGVSAVRVPIIEEMTLSRTKTGFDS
jgi:hypothetical protein